MKTPLFQNKLIVKKSSTHGYGVFAQKTIKKGEKIEECYFLLSRRGDSAFEDYYFDAKGKYAIFLGFGSIYNHSDDPNADYTINIKNRVTTIKAARTIRKGEEIFVSYGEEWFKSRDMKPKQIKKG
jgi:SET domain-containing protein